MNSEKRREVDPIELITPLSLNQITPEIRLLASRCIIGDGESGSFSKDAHKYAAYTIIRERQLLEALAKISQLEQQAEEAGREIERLNQLDPVILLHRAEAAEEELAVTKKALEMACALNPVTLLARARQQSAAEGGRG